VRTIIRRENAYEFARATTAALVRRYGAPLSDPAASVTHRFPTPHVLAEADPATFGVDARRARAISDLARRGLYLDAGSKVDEEVEALLAIDGIGPWIASYIAMRALGHPDAYLEDCDRIARALQRAPATAAPEHWHPYSSYAIAALWRTLDDTDPIGVQFGGGRTSAQPAVPITKAMISPATSSAVRGLNDAAFRFDTSATNIASGSTDLPTDIVEGEMLAPTAYTANAKVLETQAAMNKALLDIRA